MVICLVAVILINTILVFDVFKIAGATCWKAWVPVLNIAEWFDMAGVNPWLVILMFIPGVNILIHILVGVNLSKRFSLGKVGVFFYIVAPHLVLLHLAIGRNVQYSRI